MVILWYLKNNLATDIEKFQKISNSARPFCKDFFQFCVVEELCILL